jgi:integrase
MDPNKLVNLMGHSSKKMVYDVYGNYVQGLEKDAGKILSYFGRDFLGLQDTTVLPFTKIHGESYGESCAE